MRSDRGLRQGDGQESGVLAPAHEVELRLMLGWQLCDEPGCENVRMTLPASPMRESRPDAS
jgi:hypothetical protein